MLLWQVLAGEKEWTRSTEFRCKDLTYTVAGLMEGADYYIRVVAVNDAGPGAPGVTEPVMVKEPQGYYTYLDFVLKLLVPLHLVEFQMLLGFCTTNRSDC